MTLYAGDLKAIVKGQLALYDLETDPTEKQDLSQESLAVPAFQQRLSDITTDNNRRMTGFYPSGGKETHQLSEEEIERLRNLGYLE
jgi:hypothetical protein